MKKLITPSEYNKLNDEGKYYYGPIMPHLVERNIDKLIVDSVINSKVLAKRILHDKTPVKKLKFKKDLT